MLITYSRSAGSNSREYVEQKLKEPAYEDKLFQSFQVWPKKTRTRGFILQVIFTHQDLKRQRQKNRGGYGQKRSTSEIKLFQNTDPALHFQLCRGSQLQPLPKFTSGLLQTFVFHWVTKPVDLRVFWNKLNGSWSFSTIKETLIP